MVPARVNGIDSAIHNITVRSSRDSAVGVSTGYGLDDQGVGVRVLVGLRIFSSPQRPDKL
jgi:hypothetical protein